MINKKNYCQYLKIMIWTWLTLVAWTIYLVYDQTVYAWVTVLIITYQALNVWSYVENKDEKKKAGGGNMRRVFRRGDIIGPLIDQVIDQKSILFEVNGMKYKLRRRE